MIHSYFGRLFGSGWVLAGDAAYEKDSPMPSTTNWPVSAR